MPISAYVKPGRHGCRLGEYSGMSFERRRGATPFADLNQLLAELVDGVGQLLGDNFCGAYLQGSFAVAHADATATWTSSS
jgi:hypothetical protein